MLHRNYLAYTVFAAGLLLCALGGTAADKPKAESGQWYKGNTHTHSLWSDGNDFPEMIVDWYHKRGYHFLALSDHNILSRGDKWMTVASVVKRAGGQDIMEKYLARFGTFGVSRKTVKGKEQVRLKALKEFRPLFEKEGKFLLIEGEEITDHFGRLPVHINAINLKELIPPQHGKSVEDVIRRNLQAVRAQEKKTGQPILDHLNHPNFGWGVTAENLANVLEERYFEIYNGHPSVRQLGDKDHPSVERLWDIANTIRITKLNAPPLYGMATDDSHTYHGRKNVSPGRGWVMVRASELSASALIKAMRRGDFYASTGVTLTQVNYDVKTRTLSIEIKPEDKATYTTEFIGTTKADRKAHGDKKGFDYAGKVLSKVKGTQASYKLTGDEFYVRAVVTSSLAHVNPSIKGQKRQAWVQPVGWIDNIDPQETKKGK